MYDNFDNLAENFYVTPSLRKYVSEILEDFVNNDKLNQYQPYFSFEDVDVAGVPDQAERIEAEPFSYIVPVKSDNANRMLLEFRDAIEMFVKDYSDYEEVVKHGGFVDVR